MANTDLLGYTKAVYVYAIIQCVGYCLSIAGLIFLYFPIIGINICKKWDATEVRCVGLVQFFSIIVYDLAIIGGYMWCYTLWDEFLHEEVYCSLYCFYACWFMGPLCHHNGVHVVEANNLHSGGAEKGISGCTLQLLLT